MVSNSKVKAAANIKKNRLDISLSGNIDVKALESLYTDIRFCVADLRKGFTVVNDISQCSLFYLNSLSVYKKIIDFLLASHVGELIKIIKNDNISFKQMLKFSEKIQCYRPTYAEDREEVENRLTMLIKRDGLRFTLQDFPCKYQFNNQNGTGEIVDISVSGCAIKAATIPLIAGSEIDMSIIFAPHATLHSEFPVKAKVVRTGENLFAAQFLDLDDERKQAFYKRLIHEVSQISFIL